MKAPNFDGWKQIIILRYISCFYYTLLLSLDTYNLRNKHELIYLINYH